MSNNNKSPKAQIKALRFLSWKIAQIKGKNHESSRPKK